MRRKTPALDARRAPIFSQPRMRHAVARGGADRATAISPCNSLETGCEDFLQMSDGHRHDSCRKAQGGSNALHIDRDSVGALVRIETFRRGRRTDFAEEKWQRFW
jgi:hypothetical protein